MKDPIPQFSNLIEQLKPLGLAYLHLVDASETGDSNIAHSDRVQNYPLIEKWQGSNSPIIICGGQDVETAKRTVDVDHVGRDVVIAMGRNFLSTPDLIFRLKRGIAPNMFEKSFFYRPAGPQGYIDYPCSEEWRSEQRTNGAYKSEAPI